MNDLVGVTRRISQEQMEAAYRQGVFPMAVPHLRAYTWHRPDPRGIMPLDAFHTPRSLKKTLRQGLFSTTCDRDFLGVMRACAEGRPVWIGKEFFRLYGALQRQGKAHSVEVWRDGRMVGGTYGVHLGGAFCAESMFHRETDASKVALCALVERLREREFAVLDVQYVTPHLAQFGAIWISAAEYERRLKAALTLECSFV